MATRSFKSQPHQSGCKWHSDKDWGHWRGMGAGKEGCHGRGRGRSAHLPGKFEGETLWFYRQGAFKVKYGENFCCVDTKVLWVSQLCCVFLICLMVYIFTSICFYKIFFLCCAQEFFESRFSEYKLQIKFVTVWHSLQSIHKRLWYYYRCVSSFLDRS